MVPSSYRQPSVVKWFKVEVILMDPCAVACPVHVRCCMFGGMQVIYSVAQVLAVVVVDSQN